MSSRSQQPVLFRAGLVDAPPLPLEEDYLDRLDFTCHRFPIDLDLGGIHLRIRVDDQDLADHIRKKYGAYLEPADPDVVLDVRVMPEIPFATLISTFCTYRQQDLMAAKFRDMAGYVDLKKRTGKAVVGPRNFNQDFENILRPILCALTPLFDAVLFHTSALAKDGRGYIFFGPSGAGKSTITKLSSAFATVLTDDMIVLRHHEGRVMAQTCGFWGGRTTEYPSLKLAVPIRAFCSLRKSPVSKVVPMSRSEAVLTFLVNIPSVARTVEEQDGLLDLARVFAEKCPFLELHFSKDDPSFWETLEEGLKAAGA